MEEEKDKYIYGVKSNIVNARKILHDENLSDEEKLKALKDSLVALHIQKYELLQQLSDTGLSEEENDSIQAKLIELQGQITDIEESDIIKSSDVVDEVQFLLEKVKTLKRAKTGTEVSFVDMETIEERIALYKEMLVKSNISGFGDRKVELTKLIADEEAELNELKAQRKDSVVEREVEVFDDFPEGDYISPLFVEYVQGLRERISSREAVIQFSPYAHKAARNLFEELDAWKDELRILESTTRSEEDQRKYDSVIESLASKAREREIAELETKIKSREAILFFSGRGNRVSEESTRELEAWQKRLAILRDDSVTNPYKNQEIILERTSHMEKVREEKENPELEDKIAKLEAKIADDRKQLEEVESELAKDPAERDEQTRIAHHRIQELETIAMQKELFRVNEEGEVEVIYEPITPEVDWKKIEKQYKANVEDMLDKYYGNREKEHIYRDYMKQLKSHIKLVRYKYVDENGKQKIGVYQTVEKFEGMDRVLRFLNLEEYPERLERKTKYEDGDKSVYKGIKDANGEEIPADVLIAEDADYIETNNNAYNRLSATRKNLMTLGKYGEKVAMTKYVEGQGVRNVFRGIGNGLKWIRNHTTAPINKFIGSKIVSPIYGFISGSDDNEKGLYANKRSHRYAARREYFQEQGKGFFASRWNALVHYKEGNAAITSAAAYEIEQETRRNALDSAMKEAAYSQITLKAKSISEQIELLTQQREKAESEEDKEKLTRTIERLEQAELQNIEHGNELQNAQVRKDVQTDAIDRDTHDIANKENVTRVVTGVKVFAKAAIHFFAVRKLKDVLMERATYQEEVTTGGDLVKSSRYVPPTQKTIEVPNEIDVPNTDLPLNGIMSSNAGKTVEAYYSVYGGERGARAMTLNGSERITAIFQGVGERGTGLSDTVGLQAPVLVDRSFPAELLDASGHVKQGLSLDTIMKALGSDSVNPETFQDLYVSVGDRAWVKVSDLMTGLTKKITRGTTTRVIDVDGYFEPYEYTTEIVKTLETRVNPTAVNALHTMGVTDDIIFGGLLADDIYENLRRTETDVKGIKPSPRKYDADYGFSGTRQDKEKARKMKMKKEKSGEEKEPEKKNEADERE